MSQIVSKVEINYPKILIIGNAINLKSGGGITLYNLLIGWPKDKIIMAANRIEKDGLDICNKYYRFGHDETKRPWPLNKFQPYYKSEEVILAKSDKKSNGMLSDYSLKKSKYKKSSKFILTRILHFFGIYNHLFPFKPSRKFISWIEEEKPDVLYTQLGSIESTLFIAKLMKMISIPVAVHIMDDWISLIKRPGFSRLYWNQKVNHNFKYILEHASGRMGICKEMGDEYKSRYGLQFVPFQNCIDFRFWNKNVKKNWDIHGDFIILYAGRIGQGTSNSVIILSNAIEIMANDGFHIKFQVQSIIASKEIREKLGQNKNTIINEYIPYEELPHRFSSVDLLILPMDFDFKNLKFIRHSMPTKVPEYMASGTPILVFADTSTALYKYATDEKWAFVLGNDSINSLIIEIKKIIHNKRFRIEKAKMALEIARRNHIGEHVRNDFRDYLFSIK